jgi:hypothetical protein
MNRPLVWILRCAIPSADPREDGIRAARTPQRQTPADALQVFNRRQRGGRYWFAHGWNWRGITAWWLAALIGVLFTNIPGQFVGPLGDLAGGVDISLPLSLVVAAVLYLTLLRLFPEPREVYGPEGARLVRTVEVPVPPISGPGALSVPSTTLPS